jgi:tRNA (cmo5U34)-methyltransferase
MAKEETQDGAPGSWTFASIGEEFDPHVRKHLPGYDTVQELAVSAAQWRIREGITAVDVGCSTGHTLVEMARTSDYAFDAYGIDPDAGMVERARKRVSQHPEIRAQLAFRQGALPDADLPECDLLLALFSLQFVDPVDRLKALGQLAAILRPGALVIVAEKCAAPNASTADMWSGLYSDWKLRGGVSADEILLKWARLRGQLISWPAATYEEWARSQGLEGDVIWAWGPFRMWAWWKPVVHTSAVDF